MDDERRERDERGDRAIGTAAEGRDRSPIHANDASPRLSFRSRLTMAPSQGFRSRC